MANDSVARAMAATAMSETPVYTSDLINNGTGNSPFSIVSETGHRIDLEMDSTTYEMVAKLYDKNNNLLNTSTAIDLPLESLVVNVQYDAANQKLIVTLKNGTTIDVPISGLISGLATQTWVQSQGYLTEHQSLDGKQDKYPKLTITQDLIIAVDPIVIQLTDAQALQVESTDTVIMALDLTAVGMSVNYWKRMYDLSGYVIFEDFVDGDGTQGQARYESSTKQLRYSTKQFQEKLTAGQNITISNNVISATGGGSDNLFTVTFTVSGVTTSADKTYAEIVSAIEAGKKVIGVKNTAKKYLYELTQYSQNQYILFTSVFMDTDYSPQNVIQSLKIYPNNNVITNIATLSEVSGTNDGTNWTTITIDGVEKNIPSGGGADNLYICTFTGTSIISVTACDRTFDEIVAAVNDGKKVVGKLVTSTANISTINNYELTTVTIWTTGSSANTAMFNKLNGLNSTNQIIIAKNRTTSAETYTAQTMGLATTTLLATYQQKLIAGSNITIAADLKTISATDTTYSAGSGISINNDVINMVNPTYKVKFTKNKDTEEISCDRAFGDIASAIINGYTIDGLYVTVNENYDELLRHQCTLSYYNIETYTMEFTAVYGLVAIDIRYSYDPDTMASALSINGTRYSNVSGEDDGTNWTNITIDGITKNVLSSANFTLNGTTLEITM